LGVQGKVIDYQNDTLKCTAQFLIKCVNGCSTLSIHRKLAIITIVSTNGASLRFPVHNKIYCYHQQTSDNRTKNGQSFQLYKWLHACRKFNSICSKTVQLRVENLANIFQVFSHYKFCFPVAICFMQHICF